MKTTKETVITNQTIDYLSCLIFVGNKCLMFRNVDEANFRKYGYFFPGCKRNNKYDDSSLLQAQLKLKYGLDVAISCPIYNVITKENDKLYCLYLYKGNIDKAPIISNKNVSFSLVDPNDFNRINIDKGDKILLERISKFAKVYQGIFSSEKRPENDIQTILSFYDILLKNKKSIIKQDLIDFKSLIETSASMSEIKNAFDYLISKSKIDLGEQN